MALAVIVGSAFDETSLAELGFEPLAPPYFFSRNGGEEIILARHGVPHVLLPNQIPYREQARRLKELGCNALLITSSVGVLDGSIPLFEPLLVCDLFMVDNRLPDGSACTMWPNPAAMQGHLVLEGGLCSRTLGTQLKSILGRDLPEVRFAYIGGPRTKTRFENQWLSSIGCQVNSMTLGPELVLANELEIPTAAVVWGHKYSLGDGKRDGAELGIEESLVASRTAAKRLVDDFLRRGRAVAFENKIYRF